MIASSGTMLKEACHAFVDPDLTASFCPSERGRWNRSNMDGRCPRNRQGAADAISNCLHDASLYCFSSRTRLERLAVSRIPVRRLGYDAPGGPRDGAGC